MKHKKKKVPIKKSVDKTATGKVILGSLEEQGYKKTGKSLQGQVVID